MSESTGKTGTLGWLGTVVGGLLAVGLVGCSSAHYRRAADKDVYRIIQDAEKRVFGRTNQFNIETRYSGRDPKAIPPAEIIQDRMATNCRVLNLEQALELAVKTSREYQTQKEQLYLAGLALTGTRYQFTPQFFARSTAAVSGTPDGVQSGTLGSSAGGQKVSQFVQTGGKLTVSLANDLLRYVVGSSPSGARNSAVNAFTVNLTQPLLRGFGKNDPTVELITQTERNVIYAVRSFSLYQQQFLVNVVNDYYSLLTQKDIVRNNYRNYTNRVETTKFLEARAVDRERMSSVYDARTSELGARRDYINSLASYLTTLDSFKTRLGLPLSEALYLDDGDMKELIASGLVPAEIDRQAAFRICTAKHMDILNAIDRFEDKKRQVRLAVDAFKPGLNLAARADLSSERPDDYANFDLNKVNYTASATLDLPLDRFQQRNSYRQVLVEFEVQLRSLASTLDTYKDRIDRNLRTLEQSRLNYLNAVESLNVAKRRLENNVMLLEAGRAYIRDVREAQDGLILAENNLASIYAAYLANRLGLLLSIGMLETRPQRFWLFDPLKGQLSPEQIGPPVLRMPDDKVLPPERFIAPVS